LIVAVTSNLIYDRNAIVDAPIGLTADVLNAWFITVLTDMVNASGLSTPYRTNKDGVDLLDAQLNETDVIASDIENYDDVLQAALYVIKNWTNGKADGWDQDDIGNFKITGSFHNQFSDEQPAELENQSDTYTGTEPPDEEEVPDDLLDTMTDKNPLSGGGNTFWVDKMFQMIALREDFNIDGINQEELFGSQIISESSFKMWQNGTLLSDSFTLTPVQNWGSWNRNISTQAYSGGTNVMPMGGGGALGQFQLMSSTFKQGYSGGSPVFERAPVKVPMYTTAGQGKFFFPIQALPTEGFTREPFSEAGNNAWYSLPTTFTKEEFLQSASSLSWTQIGLEPRSDFEYTKDGFSVGWLQGTDPSRPCNGSSTSEKTTDLSSQVDGIVEDFTMPEAYKTGSLRVYWNGQRLTNEAIVSETSSTTFRLTFIPSISTVLLVDYEVSV